MVLISCAVAGAQDYRPVQFALEPDPAETLRATFDGGISADGTTGYDADFARGSAAMVPTAYDRGIEKDIAAYRAVTIDDGARGKAIRVGPGRAQRYSALGNVNLRRGTIAFYVRFSQPLGEVHLPIMMVNTTGRTGTIIALRGRYRSVLCHGPFSGNYDFEAKPWDADVWHHITVSWDELSGIRLYKNGQLTRKQDMTWQTEDLEPGYLFLGSWDHWGGTPVAIDFDELRVFSRPLTDEEVAQVAAGQERITAASEHASVAPEHRRQYLGWESCPELAAIEPAPEGETLLVRTVGIEDTRAVRTDAWKVTDGDRVTRWPLTYHGYSFQHEAGLSIKLFDGPPWDYMRIWGPCNGKLYRGLHILRPEAEPMMPLSFSGPLLTRAFDGPMSQREMTLFADSIEEDTEAPQARVGEIGFFSVGPARSDELPGPAQSCYLSAQQWTAWDSEIGLQMQSRFDTADRGTLKLSPQAPDEARSLPMKAMGYYHLMVEPSAADRPLDAIRVALYFRDLAPETVLWLRVMDPLIPTRHIADFEVRAQGDWSGVRRADLTLDMRDYVIPGDRPLWLSLMTGADAELVWDAEHASRVELLLTTPEALGDQYLYDQVKFIKDRFIDVSEPRPWGRTEMADLANRTGVFTELHRALQDAHERFPADAGVNAFYIWTHPREPVDRSHLTPPEVAGAPEWAVYQRAAFGRYRDFVNWWIDERQVENGEFGHNYGDDTDLINDWLSVAAISDTDGRIADSVRRIADYCWDNGKLTDGVNTRATDPLHAYEDGTNAMCRTAEMYYGNPVYLERLMIATRAVRERFMAETGGHLHFRSTLYGANQVVSEPPYDRDALSSTLMLHPALYLGWYSHNRYAREQVRGYGDAWLELFERAVAEKGPLASSDRVSFPTSIRFEDRSVTGSGKYPTGYGHHSMFLALQEWYGEKDYPLVMRAWLTRDSQHTSAQVDWLPFMDLTPWRESLLARAAAVSYENLDPSMGNDSRNQVQYLQWRLTGEREPIVQALRDSWERIELLFPMHTWAEQSADRVAISKDLVDRMYLGGTPGYRNTIYPTHSITWHGFSPDFAAWVLESDYEHLRLMAWNFAPATQQGTVRIHRLKPGVYRVRVGPDADEDGVPDRTASEEQIELARGSEVGLALPPGELTALSIELLTATKEDYFARPDLAICPQDTVISEDATQVTVVVHNIGGGDAPECGVRIVMDGEQTVLDARAAALTAPTDCVPRMTEVRWTVPDNLRGRQFTVIVDPDDQVRELFEGNNVVELAAG